jgi:peroxiredoxin Q/BCP
MPLLADSDGAVAVSYGVRRRFITPVKRATFVIGRDQQILEVVQSEVSMQTHADTALKVLSAPQ